MSMGDWLRELFTPRKASAQKTVRLKLRNTGGGHLSHAGRRPGSDHARTGCELIRKVMEVHRAKQTVLG